MADIRQSGSYQKIPKPAKAAKKEPWIKRVRAAWAKSWHFEKLLVLLIVLVLPFWLMDIFDTLVSRLAMVGEASKIAQTLRALKDKAHELNAVGTLKATPAEAGGLSSYQVSFDRPEIGARQVLLPKGISLVGSVSFDPQGVPDRISVLRLRHGLQHVNVLVSAQGAISIP